MRLFSVMTMIGLSSVIERYQDQISIKEWLNISFPLMLATAVKPSFLIGFSWALLGFLIVGVIKEKMSMHSVAQCFKLGSTVFLALIILYLQSKVLYKPGGESGMAISFLKSTFFSLGMMGTILK